MAGAGRRTFTPGEVLTASNVMNYLQDQAVMKFAGTAARGSAIGTAVAEGMVSYLADTNSVEVYDGSAWNSLAYPVNVGLTPIIPTGVNYTSGSASYNSTTGVISFTGVNAISPQGVFTSAYRNYTIFGNIDTTSGTGGDMALRMNLSGTDSNTNVYYTSGRWINSVAAENTYVANAQSLGYFGNLYSISGTFTSFKMDLFNPAQARNTLIQTRFNGLSPAGPPASYITSNLHDLATAYNGITMYGVSGTLITGTVKVYGWN